MSQIPETPVTPIIHEAFRFVHIHEPELMDGDALQRFISPPDSVGKSNKKNALEPLASLNEVMAVAPDLYSFAMQLRKGKRLSNEDLAKAVSQTEPLKEAQRVLLWENLYHQLLEGKSRTLMRAITKLIQADHFVTLYKNADATGEEQSRAYWDGISKATLLTPKDLFPEREQPEETQTKYADNLSHSIVLRRLNFDVAKYRMKQLRKTIEEIKDAEKSYGQLYRLDYEKAQADYQEEIERLRTEAEAERLPVEEGEELTPIEIDYPPFEFTPPNPFAQDELSRSVSPETYEHITAIKKDSDENLIDVRKSVQKAAGKESLRFVQNTPKPGQSKMFNNIRVPFRNRPLSDMIAFKGVELPHKPGYYALYLTQYFSRHAAKATQITVILNPEEDGKGTPSTSCKPIAVKEEYITYELFPEGIEMPQSCEPIALKIQYTKDDGTVTTFPEIANDPGVILTDNGGGTILVADEYDGDTVSPPSEGENQTSLPGPYFPTKYGITNLGIGDFMKVEQELSCYTEGEVSRIENVMAKEFKQRSTRNLVRSEITVEESSEREVENLTDTTSTERYEMQTEISETLQEDQSRNFGASASVSGGFGGFGFSASANYSTTSSSSTSSGFNEAQAYAQEVTERAMQRVVEKVSRKRTSRILREFEETNEHGFDNREGDFHVTGIYRWIDKIYNNKLHNYGKRLMYEFMVPEPAKNFKHYLAGDENGATVNNDGTIVAPQLPRDPEVILAENNGLLDFIDRNTFGELAGIYGAEIEPLPPQEIEIGKAYAENVYLSGSKPFADTDTTDRLSGAYSYEVDIPEGYHCTRATAKVSIFTHSQYPGQPSEGDSHAHILIGNDTFTLRQTGAAGVFPFAVFNMQQVPQQEVTLPISIRTRSVGAFNLNSTIFCELKSETMEAWRQQAFMALKAAYRERVQEYNDYIAQQQAQQAPQDEEENNNFLINPLIARAIEKRELKKLAIWLITKINTAPNGTDIRDIGLDMYNNTEHPNGGFDPRFSFYEEYAAQIKFLEEAFDWEVMAYTLYPYYWTQRLRWEELIKTTSNSDFIFQSFLQAGMGKMIVPVKAGYEQAVMYYLNTGQILSPDTQIIPEFDEYQGIMEALNMPQDTEVGESWKTRIPTSLTIIQTGSNPLDLDGLGCTDPEGGGNLAGAGADGSNTLEPQDPQG